MGALVVDVVVATVVCASNDLGARMRTESNAITIAPLASEHRFHREPGELNLCKVEPVVERLPQV